MPFLNDTADVIHHLYCSLCLYMYNTQTNMQRHRQSSTLDRTIFYSPFRIMLIDDVVVLAVSELLTAQHTLTQIHHATGKHLFADEWNAEISIESIMMTAFEFFFLFCCPLATRPTTQHIFVNTNWLAAFQHWITSTCMQPYAFSVPFVNGAQRQWIW